jgi:hypothetical protein
MISNFARILGISTSGTAPGAATTTAACLTARRVKWSETEVHETLLLPAGRCRKWAGGLPAPLLGTKHQRVRQKAVHYARLSALNMPTPAKRLGFF